MAKPTQKQRREDIVSYRKKQMSIAYYDLAKEQSESPFHSYWFNRYYDNNTTKALLAAKLDAPHHLNSRDDTQIYDDINWLITISMLEHGFCEDGCKEWNMTGTEYEYCMLWALRDSPKFRWRAPLKLKEQKILPDRIEELQHFTRSVLTDEPNHRRNGSTGKSRNTTQV